MVRAVDFAQRKGDVSDWTLVRSERRGTQVAVPAIQASMDHDHQPGQKRSDVSDLSVNRTLRQVVGEQFSANRHQRIVDV